MATRKTSSSHRSSGGRKYSPKAQEKVHEEMREMKKGKLRSGRSGKKVTNPKQAVAIGLSEARREGDKVPPRKASSRSSSRSSAASSSSRSSKGGSSSRSHRGTARGAASKSRSSSKSSASKSHSSASKSRSSSRKSSSRGR